MNDFVRVCVVADDNNAAILGMFDFAPQPDGTANTYWSMRDDDAQPTVIQALEAALEIARNAGE